ncbi:MAG: hypothetical protein IPL89_19140 [Acidobacteria bacterium]|nr:hypothetical protein [Acidobacteriota bacterium]
MALAGGMREWLCGEARSGTAASASVLLASSVAGFLLLAAPWQRADLEHLNPALALALVALAALAGPRGDRRSAALRAAGAALFAAVALAQLS